MKDDTRMGLVAGIVALAALVGIALVGVIMAWAALTINGAVHP